MNYTKRVEELFKRELKEHEATYRKQGDIEEIVVQRPRSFVYLMRYWFRDGTLTVSGDCGGAVYQWQRDINSIWAVAGLCTEGEITYFAEKCCASPVGREFRIWDKDEAIEFIEEHAIERVKEECDDCWGGECDKDHSEGVKDAILKAFWWVETHQDMCRWLYGDEAERLLGCGAWEFYEAGYTLAPQFLLHFAGLRLAYKQIRGGGEK